MINIKNIVLDLVMGLLCVVLSLTILGLMVVPIVIDTWADMRD